MPTPTPTPALVIGLTVYKLALGPLLLAQGRSLRKTAIRLPEPTGARMGAAVPATGSTPSVCRLLVVGDSSAAGVGVATQADGLACLTAGALAARLGVTVEWRLAARSGVNTTEALAMLQSLPLEPADVIVTALGVNDVTSQQSRGAFLRSYAALWEHLKAATGARLAVVSGLPPFREFPSVPWPLRAYLGSYATYLESALAAWCETHPDLAFRPLDMETQAGDMASDGYHPGPRQYRVWAEAVATQIAGLMETSGRR
ncbi:MAG: SGNH/GDSL hydrolase family protein [Pseudomonadota bacterium]